MKKFWRAFDVPWRQERSQVFILGGGRTEAERRTLRPPYNIDPNCEIHGLVIEIQMNSNKRSRPMPS